MPNENLFNDKFDLKDSSKRNEFFEQYKMYVESAEKVSDRRANANAFFISLNTMLVSIIGYFSSRFDSDLLLLLFLSGAGILTAMLWYRLIISYGQLNSAKFEIIQALEEELPAQLFKEEWDLLLKQSEQSYLTLTQTEKSVPALFGLLYLSWLGQHLFFLV